MKRCAIMQGGTQCRRQVVGSVVESGRGARFQVVQSDTPRYDKLSLGVSLFLAVALIPGCSTGPNWTRRAYSFSLATDPPAVNVPGETVTLSKVAISSLFQSRSFTYRTAENSYEQDPYSGFLVAPERALGESIRSWMRTGGAFGRVVQPGSSLIPNRVAEVFVSELCGDFRNASQLAGKMEIHFLCYEVKDGMPGRVVLDKVYARETSLKRKTPGDLMTAWDADLREIMEEINSDYAKANATLK